MQNAKYLDQETRSDKPKLDKKYNKKDRVVPKAKVSGTTNNI